MDAVQVDERDVSVEIEEYPVFRVFFWAAVDPSGPNGSTVFDVTGASVDEVLDWARERASGSALVEVHCRFDADHGQRGTILLQRWTVERPGP